MPQFTLPLHGVITLACLQAGKCYLSGFRWEILEMSALIIYILQVENTVSSVLTRKKWYLGSQEELAIPAALLCSFPSLPIAVMQLKVKLGKGNLIVN